MKSSLGIVAVAVWLLLLLVGWNGRNEAAGTNEVSVQHGLQGTWQAVSMEGRGVVGWGRLTVVVADKTLVIRVDNKVVVEAKYTLDPKRTPPAINLEFQGKDTPGIYELKDDTLRLCLGHEKARPATFAGSAGTMFLILKRQQDHANSTSNQAGLTSNQVREADSRAWYVLSQTDTNGLLLGLPERLGKTLLPSRQAGPMWYGVDDGGSLTLDVRIEGDAKGEITIGFFADARWWLAEPVQVREVVGPGRYTFTRLIPGKYRLGAMLGVPPTPAALGVHATWPTPVEIVAGRTAEARVLLSSKFQNLPAGHSTMAKDFAGQWDKMNPTRMITVRAVDSAGNPIPFCRVTFVDRGDGTQTLLFHNAGTDDQGYAYCDKIDRAFSLLVQRYDFLPERLASRYESRKMAKLYNAQDRPVITVKWNDRFPTGTGRLVGQVHDQHKQPLKEYYLTLTRYIGEQHDWSDAASYAISLPIIHPEGRFEVSDLPSGTYTVMVRHFDYSAYSWTFDGPKVTIPANPNATVHFDVEVVNLPRRSFLPTAPASWPAASWWQYSLPPSRPARPGPARASSWPILGMQPLDSQVAVPPCVDGAGRHVGRNGRGGPVAGVDGASAI